MKSLKIVQLTAENVKKLKAVRIKPDGSTIVIGGDNGEGKSSVLDTIMATLGGGKYIPKVPVREGEDKGFGELDLGEFIVKRTFTKSGGGMLTVKNKDGAIYPSPQSMLDDLVGRISFDPLLFTRMDDKAQLKTLQDVAGVDFEELETDRRVIYETRADINREIKRLSGLLASMFYDKDAPKEEVSVTELMNELTKAQDVNRENESKRYYLKEDKGSLEEAKENFERFTQQLTDCTNYIEQLTKKIEIAEGEKLVDVNVDCIKAQMESAEGVNSTIKANAEYLKNQEELKGQKGEADSCTKSLDDIDKKKIEALEKSSIPVKSLSFDENGVTLNNLPFSQASDAEKMKVSVALGIAMNPKLKVLLIRDGSLLDQKNLKMIAEMADKNDAQIWIERVGKSKEMSIIMEDGEVSGDAEARRN